MRVLCSVILWGGLAFAQSEEEWPAPRMVEVATGLRNPVDIQNAMDGSGRLFIVEQSGTIRILRDGVVLAEPFLDIRARVTSGGERGLLGLAFPPDFARKQHFYVNYTEGRGAPDLRTVVARYRVNRENADRADPASEERVLVVNQPFDNHNAGQLAFSPRDGFLYLGLGDGGGANDPLNAGQDSNTLLGKMLRIDVEAGTLPYRVPPDNPFVGRIGYRSEIWAMGLRNPWRYSFDAATGDLWIGDVGQNRREEINFQAAASAGGENYGWRIMEASLCVAANCNQQGLVAPVFEYPRDQGISVTGGVVYRGSVHPHWAGTYFLADFGSGRFWGLRRNGAGTMNRTLMTLPGWTISSFGTDESGEIYAARHGINGAVYRMADARPVTRAELVTNAASGEQGVTPGGRIRITGWGLSNRADFVYARDLADDSLDGFRIWFGEQPGRIAEIYNLGGREAVVAIAPDLLPVSEVEITIERDGVRSRPVLVHVAPVQPAIFPGVLEEAPAGSEVSVLATGLGAFRADGSCGIAVEAELGGQPASVELCEASREYAGVARIILTLPPGQNGDLPLMIRAGGVASPALTLKVQ